MRKLLTYAVVLVVGVVLGAAPTALGRKQAPQPTNAQILFWVRLTENNTRSIEQSIGDPLTRQGATVNGKLAGLRDDVSRNHMALVKLCQAQSLVCYQRHRARWLRVSARQFLAVLSGF
jgi:hypothetical protein